ncbi:hypothetical protein DXG03_004750 [Asterophora parasitica]|uniref:SPX domain-containing protein n=1 Tax=Asterophora parasitica TaxID=117018 RepID=A0A9P7KCV6_9AGAR|nr:hypothetical protein DXG03_004750 [Asterophora parasitica]
MHFSKTYTQLLLSLPPELRDNAIQYRQLKKLINQIVRELSSLGLSPAVLQELLERSKEESDDLSLDPKGKKRADDADPNETQESSPSGSPSSSPPGSAVPTRRQNLPKVTYEVVDDSGRIEPHLRLWVDSPPGEGGSESSSSPRPLDEEGDDDGFEEQHVGLIEGEQPKEQLSLLWRLQRQALRAAEERESPERSTALIVEVDASLEVAPPIVPDAPPLLDHRPNEVVIPLAADMLFFTTLSTAINDLSAHLVTVQSDFVDTLFALSRTISDSARPTSSTAGFRPHSGLTSKPWSVANVSKTKSDLYSWREIFQLYIEAEVFESVHELDRGERSLEESENRLKLFAERITTRGLGDERKLKSKASRAALESFLELNVFILNIKKFQFANAEATRKILKKHTKRTSLPLLTDAILPSSAATALPRVLVQAIGETLLPIIPHLDDYACLICTSIAFKPIRLNCGHLFCVRCLVKMQKRGKGNCPMCRAPCVLTADRTNVDWALLNFMQDWFPIEAREKLLQNEKEAAREELEELGLDPDQSCKIM